MAQPYEKLAICDPTWMALRQEAEEVAEREPVLAGLAQTSILAHARFELALAYRLAQKLGNADLSAMAVRHILDDVYAADPSLGESARADIVAVHERDPACQRYSRASRRCRPIVPLIFCGPRIARTSRSFCRIA